jgi:hypothetical protein
VPALDEVHTTIFGSLHCALRKSGKRHSVALGEHFRARHAIVCEQAAVVLQLLTSARARQPIAEHLLGHEELPTGNFLDDFGQKLALSGR